MIQKRENLIKLIVQIGRRPSHLKGSIQFIIIKDFLIWFLDPDKPYSKMTDAEIVAELKSMAGNSKKKIFNVLFV